MAKRQKTISGGAGVIVRSPATDLMNKAILLSLLFFLGCGSNKVVLLTQEEIKTISVVQDILEDVFNEDLQSVFDEVEIEFINDDWIVEDFCNNPRAYGCYRNDKKIKMKKKYNGCITVLHEYIHAVAHYIDNDLDPTHENYEILYKSTWKLCSERRNQ